MDVLYDGDFTVAQLAGPPEYEIPFKADPKPYSYKLPYWQFLANYTELPLGSAGPLGGTYVGGCAGSFKAIAAGIIEFTREYALVPDTRNEYESFVYSFQWWQCSDSCSIAEVPKTVMSRVQYDYFRVDTSQGQLAGGWTGNGTGDVVALGSISLPRAPRVIDLFGSLFFQNGYGSLVAGQEILAEDSILRLWKGNIYERVQRFIVEQGNQDQLT